MTIEHFNELTPKARKEKAFRIINRFLGNRYKNIKELEEVCIEQGFEGGILEVADRALLEPRPTYLLEDSVEENLVDFVQFWI